MREVFPFCQCRSMNKAKGYFSVPKQTSCNDGSTCDFCGHYVIWTNLEELKKDTHRESRNDEMIEHEKQLTAFLMQEYRILEE